MTGGRGREPGAVHEAGAVAAFVAVVPVAALAAAGVWVFAAEPGQRFGLLMLCLVAAGAGFAALLGYRTVRRASGADEVLATLAGPPHPGSPHPGSPHSGPPHPGPPPALPARLPGAPGWGLLGALYGAGLGCWLFGQWFLTSADPGEPGRQIPAGEALVWGGLAVAAALLCLPWEGRTRGPVAGRLRAERVVCRDGRLYGPGGEALARLAVPGTAWRVAVRGLEGAAFWICWNPARLRATTPGTGERGGPATLVTDQGYAVPARLHLLPGRHPATAGHPAGEAGAPADPERRITAWSRRTLWPLTLTWDAIRWYGAALLASGALAFEGVGLPRPLLTVAPAVLLAVAVLKTFPEHDQEPPALPASEPVPDAPVDAAPEPALSPGRSAALARLPLLHRLATAVPLAVATALVLWVTLPSVTARAWGVGACLAVCAAYLLLLAVLRLRHGTLTVADIARTALGGPAPGATPPGLPVTLPRSPRTRVGRRLAVIALACWTGGLILILPPGDVSESPRLERLRQAGAVVGDALVTGARVHEVHEIKRTKGTLDPTEITQELRVSVHDATGTARTETIHLRTRKIRAYQIGDTVRVIHAPAAPHLGVFTGRDPDHEEAADNGDWQAYQGDLARMLAGRALSGSQLGAALLVLAVVAVLPSFIPLLRGQRPLRALPAQARAAHGTCTGEGFVSDDGTVRAELRSHDLMSEPLTPLLTGVSGWLCWDPARVGRPLPTGPLYPNSRQNMYKQPYVPPKPPTAPRLRRPHHRPGQGRPPPRPLPRPHHPARRRGKPRRHPRGPPRQDPHHPPLGTHHHLAPHHQSPGPHLLRPLPRHHGRPPDRPGHRGRTPGGGGGGGAVAGGRGGGTGAGGGGRGRQVGGLPGSAPLVQCVADLGAGRPVGRVAAEHGLDQPAHGSGHGDRPVARPYDGAPLFLPRGVVRVGDMAPPGRADHERGSQGVHVRRPRRGGASSVEYLSRDLGRLVVHQAAPVREVDLGRDQAPGCQREIDQHGPAPVEEKMRGLYVSMDPALLVQLGQGRRTGPRLGEARYRGPLSRPVVRPQVVQAGAGMPRLGVPGAACPLSVVNALARQLP